MIMFSVLYISAFAIATKAARHCFRLLNTVESLSFLSYVFSFYRGTCQLILKGKGVKILAV